MKRSIIVGLLVGGAVGVLVAFLLAPKFLVLGLAAGMASGFLSGYLVHNAFDIKGAVNKAKRAAASESERLARHCKKVSGAAGRVWRGIRKHYVPVCMLLIIFAVGEALAIIASLNSEPLSVGQWILLFTGVAFVFAIPPAFICYAIPLFIMYYFDRGYMAWLPNCSPSEVFWFENGGGKAWKPTLRNTLLLCLLGWPCLVIAIAKWIAIADWLFLKLSIKFVWHLFKLVHSKEGVLCGIDCAIGTLITFLALWGSTDSAVGLAAATACGAVISLAIGVLDYEIISLRVLKIRPA